MNPLLIEDPALRDKFTGILAMTDEHLAVLGLNAVIRDRLIDGIILPNCTSAHSCWFWRKAHLGKDVKERAVIHYLGQVLLVYRVEMALLLGKNIQYRNGDDTTLKWILHTCPEQENSRCINPHHLMEGDAKLNAQHRSKYGKLHGDKNGSRRHPESRPRGSQHPKSQFKDPGDVRVIQALRATYDSAPEKQGLIYALARHFRKSPDAITGVVMQSRYTDIIDDPTAALPLSELKINHPGDSAKKREAWPKGDSHHETRMPTAAKREFFRLFHGTVEQSQKAVLISYCADRYHLKWETVRSLGYEKDPSKFGAPSKQEILDVPKIEQITVELLEAVFGNIQR